MKSFIQECAKETYCNISVPVRGVQMSEIKKIVVGQLVDTAINKPILFHVALGAIIGVLKK